MSDAPEWSVIRVGKDEWIRYKSCARIHGATVTCDHFHNTEDEAHTCLGKRMAKAALRSARLSELRTKRRADRGTTETGRAESD